MQSEKNSLAKKLEAANKNLATVESHFNVQKETMEKQARDLNSRLEDLLSQNNILHSQIDTLSTQISRFQSASPSLDMVLGGPGADTTATGEDINRRTIDELREVTRYLRREREVLDFEKEAQLQENKRLQLQLEHANRTIEETRSLLTDERQRLENGVVISRGEYSEMTSKVNQLDLIRESNTTLREENLRNQKLHMEARAKVEQLTAELEPLHEQLRNISAELEARNQEIKALEEDNARWKSRTHEILAKYDKVDPAEHRQLQENYTLLQQQSAVQVDELTKAVDAKDVALKASEERVYWRRMFHCQSGSS